MADTITDQVARRFQDSESVPAGLQSVIDTVLSYHPSSDVSVLVRAYQFADYLHRDQHRRSGEPYITHPLAVAEICASWRLDAASIMAALLHDVLEDTGSSKEELIEVFGSKVAELVVRGLIADRTSATVKTAVKSLVGATGNEGGPRKGRKGAKA